jgi:proton glutamate symport protein
MMLTSKGLAGILRAVFVVLMGPLQLPIFPSNAPALALMDMGRAMINAVGNCLANVIVVQWERQLVLSADKANE